MLFNTQGQGVRKNTVMILTASRVRHSSLLLGWLFPCREEGVKALCDKEMKGRFGEGQEGKREEAGGRESGPQSSLPPHHYAAPQVPPFFPYPNKALPCSTPSASQNPTEFRHHSHPTKWDMGPSHLFECKSLCACRCSFVHRQL